MVAPKAYRASSRQGRVAARGRVLEAPRTARPSGPRTPRYGIVQPASSEDIQALAKGGRTNVLGFVLRLAARIPFLFIAGRWYGEAALGRFAYAVLCLLYTSDAADE